MRKVVEKERALGADGLLVQRIFVERGAVTGFVVNFSATIRGEDTEVCRYDTCHGHLHVHRFWLAESAPRDIEKAAAPAKDYKERLDMALRDIATNWEAYRAKMELKK